MTRDIFSRAAIASAVADSQPSESLHNWRRLFPNARAKAIPLRETTSVANVPTEMRTSRSVGAIAPDLSSPPGRSQRHALVQQLSGTEEDILEILGSANRVVSAQTLATELECSVQGLRRRELHRLLVAGLIEAVHGRGYRRRA
jgi:hypothetical protein